MVSPEKESELKPKLTWNSNLRFNGHEGSSGNTEKQRARQDSGQMQTCHAEAGCRARTPDISVCWKL